jgi:hypothetical protein
VLFGFTATLTMGRTGPVDDLVVNTVKREVVEQATDQVTDRLQRCTTQAAETVLSLGDDAFTPAQLAAIQRNPALKPMFTGYQTDKMARELARIDPLTASVVGKINKGPDFVDIITGQWWDMTTTGQWGAHLDKYAPDYGPNGTLLDTGF